MLVSEAASVGSLPMRKLISASCMSPRTLSSMRYRSVASSYMRPKAASNWSQTSGGSQMWGTVESMRERKPALAPLEEVNDVVPLRVFWPMIDWTPTDKPLLSARAKVNEFSLGVTRLASYPPRMRLPGTLFWPVIQLVWS